MGRCYTIELLKEMADRQDLSLLSTEYTVGKPVLVECMTHGGFPMTAHDLARKCGCPMCGRYIYKNVHRIPREEIEKVAKSKGVQLKSFTYRKSACYVTLTCKEHGEFSMGLAQLKLAKYACPKCKLEAARKRYAFSLDEVREKVKGYGYVLLDDTYINAGTKLNVWCAKHGPFQISLGKLHAGERCAKCSREMRGLRSRGKNHPNWKGGTRDLMQSLRELLVSWRTKQFNRVGRRCEITGKKTGDLQVHHMNSFSGIVHRALSNLNLDLRSSPSDYSAKDWDRIQKEVLRLNELYADPVVMTSKVHQAFHEFCGGTHKPTTHKQLNLFKEFIEFYV